MTELATLKVEEPQPHTRLVTLHRPEAANAMNTRMGIELLSVFDGFNAAPGAQRCIVITGAGPRIFCAGGDLKERNGMTDQQWQDQHLIFERAIRAIIQCPVPVIAAVNGAAIAGGCGLATLCDFTLAAREAKYGYTEVKIGFIPAVVSVYLARQIGEKRARDLLLSGRIVDAQEAFTLGLVTAVVAPESLIGRAQELAATLAGSSPSSLAHTKRLLIAGAVEEVDREIDSAIAASAAVRETSDFREGVAAFLEKRAPRWTGH